MQAEVQQGSTRDEVFVKRLQSLEFVEAASLLLGAEETVEEWRQARGASFTQLALVDLPAVFTPPSTSSSFASITTICLPDNPPTRDPKRMKESFVHRLVLHTDVARHLNAQLRSDAVLSSGSFPGSSISNVGGYHSQARRFDLHNSALWFGALHRLLLEALHLLHADGEVDSVPINSLEAFGWMNVSPATAFNKLHDHGAIPYSMVYFVDDGCAASDQQASRVLPEGWLEAWDADSCKAYYHSIASQISQWERPSACAGELLLQTQLKAWTNEYAFLSVTPTPGTLWLFPGYMPHAVLPRKGTGTEDSLRVSIACNVSSCDGKSAAPLPTVWQASRMA
jgi:hypothetical protein